MRRTLTIAATTAVLTLVHALPALAAQSTGGTEIAKGSVQGIMLAFVFGILAGTYLTINAYRGVRFGQAPGHHEHADDLREGVAEYDPDVPSGTS